MDDDPGTERSDDARPPEPRRDDPLVSWAAPSEAGGAAIDAAELAARPVGTAARLVAYLIDTLFVGILPAVPMVAAVGLGAAGRALLSATPGDPVAMQALTEAMRPYAVGSAVAGVALSFVYFVGLWTTGGRATLGMRVVRIRLAAEGGGDGAVELPVAVRRWLSMGYPLTLLSAVPIAAIADLGSLAPLWQFVLLLSVATAADGRGIHDRFAGTRVERTGDGRLRVGLGCATLLVVYVALSLLFALVITALAVNAAGSI